MDAMQFLMQDEIRNIGLIQVLKRETAELIRQNDKGVFLRDTVSGAFMMSVKDIDIGILWLAENEKQGYSLMQLCQQELAEFSRETYRFETVLECRQAVYHGSEPPLSEAGAAGLKIFSDLDRKALDIGEPKAEELAFIRAHYDKLTDEELNEIHKRHDLFVGRWNGQVVGFIGNHLEGSMGLLEVVPEFRKQGFGTILECHMIKHMLEKNLIPYCQVETWNDESLALQKKLGMEVSNEKVYWLF